MASKQMLFARELLIKRVLIKQTLTYREFAAEMGVLEPPVIKKCTDILEQLIREDVAEYQPILSAMVVQQGLAGIPRVGFFQTLSLLNVYQGDNVNFWHQMEVTKLQNFYT